MTTEQYNLFSAIIFMMLVITITVILYGHI